MTEALDSLLAEALSKSLFKGREIDREQEDNKSKKSKHKSKSKTKSSKSSDRNKSINSSKNEMSKNTNNENESQVVKQLKSYASIPFKDSEQSNHKSSKHKTSKRDCERHEKNRDSNKSSKHSDSYEHHKYYYEDYSARHSSKSSLDHEDYYYGSYYEGTPSKSTHSSRKRSSRPLSPLYESKSRSDRSRSRSPNSSKYSRRSLSPNRKRSRSPLSKTKHSSQKSDTSRRRSLSPNNKSNKKRKDDRHEKIDRQKLLEIARENLLKMIERGDLPKGTNVNKLKLKHLRELTTQKSVQQWTEFCRAISALETASDSDSDLDSDSDSDDQTRSAKSANLFALRHPFKLKERKDIEIKVKDFVQLKSRTASEMAQELRQTFPVSSGDQHRRKELEWQEVEQMPPPAKKAKKAETSPAVVKTFDSVATESDISNNSNTVSDISCHSSTLATNQNQLKSDSVFPQSSMPIDIGSIMAQRLSAMRKLQTDPNNVVALKQMYQSNQMMTEWAESKIVPGQFTGSTGAKVMTGDVLNGPVNAWTRKDQLKTAAPITDGIGMYLLIKMGWNPGQGLGKNNEGPVDPIMLDIKFDKKGLVAEKEEVRNLPLQLVSVPKETGKNPVSILHELCAKKKWGTPIYEQVLEQGPDHRKNFLFKVLVNGVEYQPSVSSSNKKQARALAAGVCLQAFGLLPKDKT